MSSDGKRSMKIHEKNRTNKTNLLLSKLRFEQRKKKRRFFSILCSIQSSGGREKVNLFGSFRSVVEKRRSMQEVLCFQPREGNCFVVFDPQWRQVLVCCVEMSDLGKDFEARNVSLFGLKMVLQFTQIWCSDRSKLLGND